MKRLFLILAFASTAWPQTAYRIDPNIAVTTAGNTSPGGFPALYALQGANVLLFTNPSATTLALTYTNSSATQSCPQTAQIVEPGAICTSTAGPTGNFGWWLLPGSYWYTIIAQSVQYGPYPITVQSPTSAAAPPFGSTQINNQGALYGAQPINALGVGIKADGLTDDTTAWNALFASTLTTGGIITFPSNTGNCSKISTPIKIGNGALPMNIEFFGQSTTALENTPFTDSCILQTNPAQDIIDVQYGGGDALTIRGLVLKYAQTPPSGTAKVTGNVLAPVTGSVNGSWYVPGGHASAYVQGSSKWSTPCPSSNCTITSTTAGSSYVNPQLITDDGYISSAFSAAINQSSYTAFSWQLSAITGGGSPLTTAPSANGVLALTGTSAWSLVNVTPNTSSFTTGTGSPIVFHSLPVTSKAGDTLIIIAATFQRGTVGAAYSSMTANAGDTVIPCPLNILSGASVYNTAPLNSNTAQIMCGYVPATSGGTNAAFNVNVTTASGQIVGASVYVLEYAAGTVTYDTSNALSNASCPVASCPAPTLSPSGANDLYLQMLATGQGFLVNALGFGPPGSMTLSGNCTANCPTTGAPAQWAVGVGLHTIGTTQQVGTSVSYFTVSDAGVGISNDPDMVSTTYDRIAYHANFIGHNDGGGQQTVIDHSVFQGGTIGWNAESLLVEGLSLSNTVFEDQKGPQLRTSTTVITPHFTNIWHEFPLSDMYQVYWLGPNGTASPGWQYGTWTNCRFNGSSLGSGNVFNLVDPTIGSTGKSELTIVGGFVTNLPTPFNITAINGSSHSASDPVNSGSPGYGAISIIGTQIPLTYQIGALYTLSQSLTTYFFDIPNFVSTMVPNNFNSGTAPSYLSLGETGITISGIAQAPFLYSAAGTALPTCNAGLKGITAAVSDATGPTYLGTYTSGGTVTAGVLCNGSAWVTH